MWFYIWCLHLAIAVLLWFRRWKYAGTSMVKRFEPPLPVEPTRGLIIFGTEFSCGKTVVTAGLTATLQQEGYRARAVKPLCMGSQANVAAELEFLQRVGHSPIDYPLALASEPAGFDPGQLAKTLAWTTTQPATVIMEMPGSVATPLAWSSDQVTFWQDCADFARQIGWPAVLVGRFGARTIEQFMMAATFLRKRQINVIAMMSVQVSPDFGQGVIESDALTLALRQRTGVPYLGCVPYSPSISVPQLNQGNLLKVLSANVDFLPLACGLQLPVPQAAGA